jgi:hypothetical protein
MKDIFNLTQEELDQRLEPIVKQLIKDSFAKAGFILYRDNNCVTDADFIRKYDDGQKELVRMDRQTMEFKLIRKIR